MKKSILVLFCMLLSIIGVTNLGFTKKEPRNTPTVVVCTKVTNAIQEARLCNILEMIMVKDDRWGMPIEGEPYIQWNVLAEWDGESGKMAVAYVQTFMLPSLGGVALAIWAAVSIVEPANVKEELLEQLNRGDRGFLKWLPGAASAFDGLCKPCQEPDTQSVRSENEEDYLLHLIDSNSLASDGAGLL